MILVVRCSVLELRAAFLFITMKTNMGTALDRVLSSLILLGLLGYPDFDPRLALAQKRISVEDILFLCLPADSGEDSRPAAGATRESYEPCKNEQNITRLLYRRVNKTAGRVRCHARM